MKGHLEELRSKARVFQVMRCESCKSGLRLPAVHFLCQHSYHLKWVRSDVRIIMLIEPCVMCCFHTVAWRIPMMGSTTVQCVQRTTRRLLPYCSSWMLSPMSMKTSIGRCVLCVCAGVCFVWPCFDSHLKVIIVLISTAWAKAWRWLLRGCWLLWSGCHEQGLCVYLTYYVYCLYGVHRRWTWLYLLFLRPQVNSVPHPLHDGKIEIGNVKLDSIVILNFSVW